MKNIIRYKEYIDVLFNKNLARHKVKRIQSKLHRIGTYELIKSSKVNRFDENSEMK